MEPENNDVRLHLFCGKAGSGKSTLAREIVKAPGAVLISEDFWLNALFKEELQDVQDYLRCAAKLRTVMQPHILELLGAGMTVVLDYPANTPEMRGWMRNLVAASDAPHVMHVFDVSDETCFARVQARYAAGKHPFALTEAQFAQLAQHFVPPASEEGFTVMHHSAAS
ncbi:MAG: ATP-binding protein [Litoreibacter sp.]|nr:ATP-binding protein [Litoreibacter sp.]